MPKFSQVEDIKSFIETSVCQFGRKTFFVDKKCEISYTKFEQDINVLASYLVANGYGGKKIGIFAKNSYHWILLFFTVMRDLGIIVPIDKELPEKELKSSVKRVSLDFLFYDKSAEEKVKRLGKSCKCIPIDELDKFLLNGANLPTPTLKKMDCDYSALFFTSGTTSKSRIVMLSQKNLVSCAYQSARAFKLYPSDRYYTILPLHHTLPLMCSVLVPMTNGCSICFNRELKDMQQEMKKYRPTALVVVPRILEYMANNIKLGVKKKKKGGMVARLSKICAMGRNIGIDARMVVFRSIHKEFGGKVRMIACGGAELDSRVFEYLDQLGFNIYQGYGLTECSPILTIRGMFVKDRRGVGIPLDKVKMKIDSADSSGIGEIIIKAPQTMVGYYNDKKSTKQAIKDGWFHTGDLGKILPTGNLMIVGREKNVIIASNGKNVYPEELETLINYSPIIKESIVSGIKKWNKIKIIATVVPEAKYLKDKNLNSKIRSLVDEINSQVPDYKRINDYIVKRDDFEKTTTLKIKRGKK